MGIEAMKKTALVFAAAAFACAAASGVNAASFSLEDDFSAVTNPNGTWSYGSYTTIDDPSTFVLMDAVENFFGVTDINGYSINGFSTEFHSILKNETGAPVGLATANFAVDAVHLHPGAGGGQAVVRWTAPEDDDYSFSGAFSVADFQVLTTTTDVTITEDGAELLAGELDGVLGPTTIPFSFERSLTVGQNIDFIVGFGDDESFNFDSTRLEVDIISAAVPVPAALPLLIAGLGLLRIVSRRRDV